MTRNKSKILFNCTILLSAIGLLILSVIYSIQPMIKWGTVVGSNSNSSKKYINVKFSEEFEEMYVSEKDYIYYKNKIGKRIGFKTIRGNLEVLPPMCILILSIFILLWIIKTSIEFTE